MRGIVSDHDIEGHFRVLTALWNGEPWRELWNQLGATVEDFATLGLSIETNDAELWHFCQAHELVLFTGNRNK